MSVYSAVVLSGSNTNSNFRGFLIQARTVADDSAVGTFFVTNSGGDHQTVCTARVSVLHLCVKST